MAMKFGWNRNTQSIANPWLGCIFTTLAIAGLIGCKGNSGNVALPTSTSSTSGLMPASMLTVEYPDVQCDVPRPEMTITPTTLRDFETLKPFPITLDDAIRMALERSKVLQKLGGQVVAAPAAVSTVYDPAFTASNPGLSSEAALAAFDAQFSASLSLNHSERRFNNLFFGAGASSLISNNSPFRAELSKATAAGTTFSLRQVTDYGRNNSPANLFPGVWDVVTIAEVRQPLLAGAGVEVNQIAGPNGTIGNYNGVLIARIREDIAITDFEAAIRDLVRDVETTYWQLYFTYQDLDTKLIAQEAARETWEKQDIRFRNGTTRKDVEAQARQQYYNFRGQVNNAIVGTGAAGTGLYNTERQMRRLLDLPLNDGTLLRPSSAPTLAPIAFDWQASQDLAMEGRVELRKQRWALRQSELELIAAKNLSQWSFDMVANYGNRGFGDNLIGNAGAVKDQLAGDLDDWSVGFEVGGPVGRRAGLVGVRNAQLKLARDRVRLEEQQKQILTDLANAYSEVDRAFAQIRATVNARIAIQEELEPKRRRFEDGLDDLFSFQDVLQRAATAESSVHRAIMDYNTALLAYAYQSGTLLSNYNVSLAEEPSSEGILQAAQVKASSYRPSESDRPTSTPVSAGPVLKEKLRGSVYGLKEEPAAPVVAPADLN